VGAGTGLPRESTAVPLIPPVDSATVSRAVPPPPIAASGTTFVAPAVLDSIRTPKPASQPARRTLRDARLFLRGVSGGANIAVDGQQVHDSVLLLRSPGRHVIAVTKPGFEPWTDTLWADAGDQLARWVVATPVAAPAAVVPAPAPPAASRPTEAVLRIQVQPPARILIDKSDFGERRTLVQGVAGGSSHLISVLPVRAGYTRKDTTVTPRPGDTVTVHIRLEGGP